MLRNKERPRGLSIFHRLFFSFLATNFLIISIIGTVYYFSARQRISTYVNEQISNSLDDAVVYFNTGYNAAISSDLILLESIPAINNFLTAPKNEKNLVRFDIERLFFKLSQARGNLYRSIIFFDAYGKEKVAVRGQKRQRKLSSLSEYPRNSAKYRKIRQLFERLKAAGPGAILFEDIFDTANGKPLFIVGISKREPEIAGFGGIILLTCDLSEFVAHLAKMKIFDTNGAWLFSGNGNTILSPPEKEALLTEEPSSTYENNLLSGDAPTVAVHDSFMHYAECNLGTDEKKILQIAFSLSSDVYEGLLRGALMKAVWLIAFMTVVVFSVALVLARQLSKPISELVWASQLLSQGNFQAKVDVKSAGEIGVLARSFNEMSEALQQSIVSRDQEIAYRKQSEKSLQEKEEEIRLLLDSTAEAIYGLDINGNCTFCNPSCIRILGYDKEEDLLGCHMHTVMHHTKPDGTNYPAEECQVCQVLHSKEEVHVDDEAFWRADGTSFWAEYWSYPVKKEGEIVGAVVTFIDISERKAVEEEREKLHGQLQQAQKMEAIGTLAGGIAHDFNNILQALIGYAEMAKDGIPAGSKVVSDLDEVLNAADRAKELVKQILTFSRQTAHERKPLQVHLVVKEALKLLRASIPTTIEIREEIDTNCGCVLADPTQIHQIVMNLCTNAYHAMRGTGGVLAVEVSPVEITKDDDKVSALHLVPGPYVLLKTSDTGQGMNRATLDRIFEPYFTTKGVGEGTGMGLAVIHGIVKSCGGYIAVSSEPERGSSFDVYLPRIDSTITGSQIKNGDDIPRGSERILVIDDEEVVVLMEQRMLEPLGYTVTGMVSCEEAMKAFCSQPEKFDLVITDMTMPYMTGIDLSQKFLAIRPDIPIIMCTGFSELINEEKAKALGIREYIMKPVVRDEIARVVRKALDGK